MEDQEQNRSFLAQKVQKAREIGGIVAEGALLGVLTPVAAPILACSEAHKILVGAPDASPQKAKDAGLCAVATGGAAVVSVGVAAIFGAPLLVSGAIGAGLFGMFASIKSDLSKPQNDTAIANLDGEGEWVDISKELSDASNLGDILDILLTGQDK